MINEIILITQILFLVLAIGVFFYLINYTKNAINIYERNIEIINKFEEEKKEFQDRLLYFEILRKNYFELYLAELKDLDNNKLIEISTLQKELEEAIIKKNYELAGKLQQELNLITKFLNNGKK